MSLFLDLFMLRPNTNKAVDMIFVIRVGCVRFLNAPDHLGGQRNPVRREAFGYG
jgi:hypothetical protein